MSVLSPLKASGDGGHQLVLKLTPEGLGTVQATLTVTRGQVVVQLQADNGSARQALAAALPQLRQDLGGQGSPATVLLSDGGFGQQRPARQSSGGPTASTLGSEVDTAIDNRPAVTGRAGSHSTIDIRL